MWPWIYKKNTANIHVKVKVWYVEAMCKHLSLELLLMFKYKHNCTKAKSRSRLFSDQRLRMAPPMRYTSQLHNQRSHVFSDEATLYVSRVVVKNPSRSSHTTRTAGLFDFLAVFFSFLSSGQTCIFKLPVLRLCAFSCLLTLYELFRKACMTLNVPYWQSRSSREAFNLGRKEERPRFSSI